MRLLYVHNQAAPSGSYSDNIRTSDERDQNRSNFVKDSVKKAEKSPGGIQAKTTSSLETVTKLSSADSSLTHSLSSENRLIKGEKGLFQKLVSSGILFLRNFHDFLSETREEMVKKLNFLLRQPHSSIAAGVLLGENGLLDKEFKNDLATTGLLHIAAASGSNVSFLLAFLGTVPLFLKKHREFFGLGAIWIYCSIAQFSPSITRATIMASMQLLASISGKEYIGLWALLLTSGVMLMFKPSLISAVGFQLSVLSSGGMVLAFPKIDIFLKEHVTNTYFLEVTRAAASTVSTLLFTTPILLYQFGSFSLVAIASNALLLWMIPPIMIFTSLLLVVSFFFPALTLIFQIPAWTTLEIWIKAVKIMANIPYASVVIPRQYAFISLIFCVYLMFILYKNSKNIL